MIYDGRRDIAILIALPSRNYFELHQQQKREKKFPKECARNIVKLESDK